MKISTNSKSHCVLCMIVFKNSIKVGVALEAVVFLPEPVGFITLQKVLNIQETQFVYL